MTRWLVLVAAVVILAADVVALRTLEMDPPPAPEATVPDTDQRDRARAAARRFLDDYVDGDGRVVRRDQGGDTVSEGQAYALLLTVALDDRDGFERVWTWTRSHLQHDDGLLAWRWADGGVVDPSPAADADVDTARALLLAARRFDEPRYEHEARRILDAILAHETVDGYVVAGPWARAEGYLNPSYLDPGAFDLFGSVTDERRWREVRDTTYAAVAELGVLPPDWARLQDGPVPSGPPGQPDAQPVFGLDAQRLPVRLATDCHPEGRRLAAEMWPALREDPAAGQRSLDGHPLVDWHHPLSAVGAAAAARAAGEGQAMSDLLDRAAALQEQGPTYYGGAWVALGRVLLTTDLLTDCGSG